MTKLPQHIIDRIADWAGETASDYVYEDLPHEVKTELTGQGGPITTGEAIAERVFDNVAIAVADALEGLEV